MLASTLTFLRKTSKTKYKPIRFLKILKRKKNRKGNKLEARGCETKKVVKKQSTICEWKEIVK